MTFQVTHVRLVSITCAQCDVRYNDEGFEWFGDLDTARWAAVSDYWRELSERAEKARWVLSHADMNRLVYTRKAFNERGVDMEYVGDLLTRGSML